eukprot:1901769-Prymnesium_polylepis.1
MATLLTAVLLSRTLPELPSCAYSALDTCVLPALKRDGVVVVHSVPKLKAVRDGALRKMASCVRARPGEVIRKTLADGTRRYTMDAADGAALNTTCDGLKLATDQLRSGGRRGPAGTS